VQGRILPQAAWITNLFLIVGYSGFQGYARLMTHVLATASLHDGGGIFSLAWSLVVIPVGLAMMLNYRGMAERQSWRGRGRTRTPMNPQLARVMGGIFLAFGLFALFEAIHRFAQGGY
jgi:hypothetical protein